MQNKIFIKTGKSNFYSNSHLILYAALAVWTSETEEHKHGKKRKMIFTRNAKKLLKRITFPYVTLGGSSKHVQKSSFINCKTSQVSFYHWMAFKMTVFFFPDWPTFNSNNQKRAHQSTRWIQGPQMLKMIGILQPPPLPLQIKINFFPKNGPTGRVT